MSQTSLLFSTEYSLILVNILIEQSSAFALRQLAGVLFKQYVNMHWSSSGEKFEEPEIDAGVKQRVKDLLPLGLNDPASKIRTTVAFAIASLASWDWPEHWPALWPQLMVCLNGGGAVTTAAGRSGANVDLNAVHGALETLTEIVQEVTDIQMPQVGPSVIPQLYRIFVEPQHYSIALRRRAIEIFTSLVNVIAEMSEYDSVIVPTKSCTTE